MNTIRSLAATLAVLGAACASAPQTQPGEPPAPAVDSAPRAMPEAAAALALWQDAAFQRRFHESYLAESDVEPPVADNELADLQAASAALAAGRHDEAIALLEAGRRPEASAALDFTLGNVRFQQEQLAPAAAAYRAAVEKFPRFRRAWKNLGLTAARANETAEAVRAFSRVIELGGGDALTYGLLGFAHAGAGDHTAAESAYRFAILLDPHSADWSVGLARSLFEQQRFAEAASLCAALLAKQPGRADLWLLQANAYLGLGQPARAAECLELVDRLGASTPESLATLGDICVNEQIFDLAVDAHLRALRQRPEGTPARALRAGRAIVAHGALAEARALLEGIEAAYAGRLEAGSRKELLRLRARLVVAGHGGDEEARVLREIVELDPLDGEALLLLGQHAARTGDAVQAAAWYERAAGLEAFEADAKVRHAQLLVGQGKYADALPLLRRAQALKPREHVQEYLTQVERAAQPR